ncbi:MAG: nucleotidyltransferase domain-containing protein [Verrucomicrobia bacterium]|nr:nucleotidyltransferase domain-containing protein [Verrucomicrobiota bacterium]
MSIAELPIAIDRSQIAAFCRERGIRKLSLFGSVLRDDFDPQHSDVDVLAEFEPEALRESGWEFFLYGEQLGQLLGHKVDFCTHLRPWLQPIVEKQALTVYDESAS